MLSVCTPVRQREDLVGDCPASPQLIHTIQRTDSALALCDNDWNELSDCNENKHHTDPDTASIGYYSRPSSRVDPLDGPRVGDGRSPLLSERHAISECSDDNLNEVNLLLLQESKLEVEADIDGRMAETKVKMGDAFLSNGREELINNRKKKHFLKQKEHLTKGTANMAAIIQQSPSLQRKGIGSLPSNSSEEMDTSDSMSCLDIPEKIVKDMEEKLKKDEEDNMSIEEGFVLCASNNLNTRREELPIRRTSDVHLRHKKQMRENRGRGNISRREKMMNRRSMPLPPPTHQGMYRRRNHSPDNREFEVFTNEAVLPTVDWDSLEESLQVSQLRENRRRNDREEIRRRLAMGAEEEATDAKKEPLQTRLQTGMNLQICFMNETASDCESQCSDTESTQDHHIDYPKKKGLQKGLSCPDFQSRQIQLQSEARQALSQAKDMARMQMEVDRQKNRCSPVTQIIRDSYNKIGLTFPDNKRRLSRQLLTDMNVAQLQVIVNHLHSQIESLNEELVEHLLGRDDYHMEQDSRLVDIEDLTNHLKAKQSSPTSSCSPIDGPSPHPLRPK